MTHEGLTADVKPTLVAAHLIGRAPGVINDVSGELFYELVNSAAAGVLRYVDDEATGYLRAIAIDAIALETASRIEYSKFPSQQSPGDNGRGFYLHRLYLERLEEIRTHPDANRHSGGRARGAIVADLTGYGVPEPEGVTP